MWNFRQLSRSVSCCESPPSTRALCPAAPSPTSSTLPWRPSEDIKVDRETKKFCVNLIISNQDWEFIHPKTPAVIKTSILERQSRWRKLLWLISYKPTIHFVLIVLLFFMYSLSIKSSTRDCFQLCLLTCGRRTECVLDYYSTLIMVLYGIMVESTY